jgi:DNA-binding MarR family transcriptional regulator
MDYRFDNTLIHLIHRASQAAHDAFARENADGVTARQLVVLAVVADASGCCQTDIVERTGIDRSTLVDIMRRLEKGRFITRQRAKHDTRAYELHITTEGSRALAAGVELTKRAEKALGARLSAGGKLQLVTLLKELTGTPEAAGGERKTGRAQGSNGHARAKART